jgi:hypothetical protein
MKKYLAIVCVALLLLGRLAFASDIPVTQLIFEELEPGIDPYTTRLLMNKRYLRFDDGDDAGDFVLYDRVKGEIYNINHDDRSMIMIQRGAPMQLDTSVSFTVQSRVLENAPRVDNMVAVEHQFIAEGKLCKTSINFNGLLPHVVKALIQYQSVLMQQNQKTISTMPETVKTPCYLANNYFHQSAEYKEGFPVQVLDYQGREKRLLDFAEINKPSSLFERPEGYRIFYPLD